MEEYGHVREGETPEIIGVRLATYVEAPRLHGREGIQRADGRCQGRQDASSESGRGYTETPIFSAARSWEPAMR